MELTVFLTTLIFPLITRPQVGLPAAWKMIYWQPPNPPLAEEAVRFIEQSYAKGTRPLTPEFTRHSPAAKPLADGRSDGEWVKGVNEEVRACSLNYCSVKFRQSLEPKLLAKVPETGFFVLVDVNENREYVFEDGELIGEYLVSTGSLTRFKSSYCTPIGKWKIMEKRKTNPGGEFGPYFLRLAKLDGKHFVPTSIALHGTNEPELLGKPASHGCIRHANEAISHLFQILPIGTIVETID